MHVHSSSTEGLESQLDQLDLTRDILRRLSNHYLPSFDRPSLEIPPSSLFSETTIVSPVSAFTNPSIGNPDSILSPEEEESPVSALHHNFSLIRQPAELSGLIRIKPFCGLRDGSENPEEFLDDVECAAKPSKHTRTLHLRSDWKNRTADSSTSIWQRIATQNTGGNMC